MQQCSVSLAPAVERQPYVCLEASRRFIGLHDNVLLYLSLTLLVLSTVDNGMPGSIIKLCWLASFVALAFVNIGAALAAYISSLAIYSPLRFPQGAPVLQRPDNFAVVILFIAMLLLVLNRPGTRPRFPGYILAFLIFSILHGVFFSPTQFPALFRDVVIPLLACGLLTIIGLGERELNALLNGMAVLGSYMGMVSVLERIPAYGWILPPWIGNVSLRPFDPFLDAWIGAGRSGGTLLQPAFNGLLLSLIFVILIPRARRRGSWLLAVAMFLCVAGSFFTYTRGVWLGLILALLWSPGWCGSLRQANVRRAALAIFAITFLFAAGGMASERLQDGGTVLYRLNLWGAALRLVLAHPLLGIGFFNFGTALPNAEQGFGSLIPSFRNVEEGVASHNTLLTVLVEFGIVGCLLYAAVFFKIVQRAGKNAVRLWGNWGTVWAVAFAIVYLVNAQFISAFEGTTNTAFFALLGVIAGARENSLVTA